MSIYYVDLDIDSNPGFLINDENNPMGWQQFQPFYVFGATSIIHEIRIKGTRDAAAENKLTGGLLLKAWNLKQYGPWRLRINTIGNNSGTLSNERWEIQDAIIEAHNVTHYAGAAGTVCFIRNCFVRSNYLSFTSAFGQPISYNILGSTIKTNVTVQGVNCQINITDSVIDWPNTKTFANTSVFLNSVFNRSNGWSNITITNCQFDWSPPTWPVWTATKSAWSASIAVGINTPPQPGNSPYINYADDLFGNLRQGIGAFYFSLNKMFLTQRTNRHLLKSFVLPTNGNASYFSSFGTMSVPGNTNTTLNSPWNLAFNSNGYLFVCDHNNERIIKLDSDFNFISEYSTSVTVGKPCAILAETDIYVVGINYHIIENDVLYMYINIERLDENLSSIKFTWDTLGINYRLEQRKGEIGYKPISITRGFNTNEFLIAGVRKKIYSINELDEGFSNLIDQTFYGEKPTRFLGMIHHSNGFLYLNTGIKIIKFNSSLVNVGSSDYIGKSIYGLKQSVNGHLLTYKIDNQSILEYDANLNFVKEIIKDSDDTLETDLYDVMDFVDASF